MSLSAAVANNPWMQEISDKDRVIDAKKALQQFLKLYQFLASMSVVYLLPAPTDCGLQDATYVANAGFIPEHLPGKNLALISTFTSPTRQGESAVAARFLESLGYRTARVPYCFEGDAEIKHLHDNVYVAGYGVRSDRRAYQWMEEQFGMKVIALQEVEPYLYHLDCTVFPIDRENTAVCTKLFTRAEVSALEEHTNVIDVGTEECFSGICNSVRLHNMILNASDLHDQRAGTEDYDRELKKNRRLEDIAAKFCCEVVFFNLSEFYKSGALLSCLVMHLNRYSYSIRLI
jgi:N-dimethylarginine dimethylaminohydrolase